MIDASTNMPSCYNRSGYEIHLFASQNIYLTIMFPTVQCTQKAMVACLYVI